MKKSISVISALFLSACGGGGSSGGDIIDNGNGGATSKFSVTITAGSGGTVSTNSVNVDENTTTSFTITPDDGFEIDSAAGCGGSLNGTTFTTGAVTSDCSVSVSFTAVQVQTFTVSTSVGSGGNVDPSSAVVNDGSTTTFTITPDSGFDIASVSGCDGSLSGAVFTTSTISADCTVTANFSQQTTGINGPQVVAFRVARPPTVDTDGSGINELFAVDRNGGNMVMLNGPMPELGDVDSFEWSSTGERVAYLASQDSENTVELYSVFPDGTGRVKLNGTVSAGGNILSFQWAPDGSKVAYLANQESSGVTELYVVDSDGQNNRKVNSTPTPGGAVEEFIWSKDSDHLLFTGDVNVDGLLELYLANGDGSGVKKINPAISADKTIAEYRFSPETNYVSFIVGDIDTSSSNATEYELYTYLIEGEVLSDLSDLGNFIDKQYEWTNNEELIAAHCLIRGSVGFTIGCTGAPFVRLIGPDNQGLIELNPDPTASNFGFVTELITFDSSNNLYVLVEKQEELTLFVYAETGSLLDQESLSNPTVRGFEAPSFVFTNDENFLGITYHDTWIYTISSQSSLKVYEPASLLTSSGRLKWNESNSVLYIGESPIYANESEIGALSSPDGSIFVNQEDFFTNFNTQRDHIWIGDRLYFNAVFSIVGNGTLNSVDANGSDLQTLSQSFIGNPQTEIGGMKVSANKDFIVYDVEGGTNPFNSNINNEGEAIYAVDIDGGNHVRLNPDLEFTSEIHEYKIRP